jgi:hypothetical protein
VAIDFESQSQEACYQHVARFLQDSFGDQVWTSPQQPYFVLRQGSAVATIDVQSWNEGSVVKTWSLVVTDIQPTPELYEYLLRLNADQQFGAFALDADNDIVLRHTIIGDTLDPEELRSSVEAIARTADRYDDEIVEKFGGLRAKDREAGDGTRA